MLARKRLACDGCDLLDPGPIPNGRSATPVNGEVHATFWGNCGNGDGGYGLLPIMEGVVVSAEVKPGELTS